MPITKRHSCNQTKCSKRSEFDKQSDNLFNKQQKIHGGKKNTDMTEFKSNLYGPNPSNHMLIALLQSSLSRVSKGFFVAKRPFNLFPETKLNSKGNFETFFMSGSHCVN